MTAVMPPDLASPRTDVERLAALRARLNDVLKGKPAIVHDLLVCLLARGHVLLEDRPGLGKTTLAKALAESLAGRFARVQCTPDLLPSDITGFNLFNQKTREFEFRPGPVFSDVLLADEINRATPRTQSALLEAMAERQVTVDAERFPLAEAFFVIATQNPHEQHGTYPLPEAQLDRFAMRLEIGYPDADDERAILAAAVADADPLLPWLVDRRVARVGDSPADQDRALSDLGDLLEQFPESADKDEAIRRVTALGVSPVLFDRFIRRAQGSGATGRPRREREQAAEQGPEPPSLDEARERRLLALAIAMPTAGRPILEGMKDDHLGSAEHREARRLILEGAEGWPPEMAPLEAALRAEAADGGTEEELKDAYLRVEKRALERGMLAARSSGDEAEFLRLQAMVKRVETALRSSG